MRRFISLPLLKLLEPFVFTLMLLAILITIFETLKHFFMRKHLSVAFDFYQAASKIHQNRGGNFKL